MMAAVRALARPGRPPRRWVVTALVLLAASGALIALTIAAGVSWHGNPARYFGERKFGTYLSFGVLIASAVVCGMIARRLGPVRSRRFWIGAAALFGWVACDDLFVFHERADRFLHALLGWDPDNRLTDHGDDAIVAVYGVVAAVLAYRHRHHLLGFPWMMLTMAAAFGCFSVMVVYDVMHWSKAIEDSLKVVAGTLIVVALLAAYFDPAIAARPAARAPS